MIIPIYHCSNILSLGSEFKLKKLLLNCTKGCSAILQSATNTGNKKNPTVTAQDKTELTCYVYTCTVCHMIVCR